MVRRDAARVERRPGYAFVRIIILFMSLSLPALADLAAGQTEASSGDYAAALGEFLPLARRGTRLRS